MTVRSRAPRIRAWSPARLYLRLSRRNGSQHMEQFRVNRTGEEAGGDLGTLGTKTRETALWLPPPGLSALLMPALT